MKLKITPEDVYRLMAKWEDFTDFDPVQLEQGIKVEMEHIDKSQIKTERDKQIAYKIAEWIAKAHLYEDYWYYVRLHIMEEQGEKEQKMFKKKGWDYREAFEKV